MLSLTFQRSLFVSVAITLVLVGAFAPRPPSQVELVVALALIVFLGVPHGALDILFLRKVRGIQSKSQISYLVCGYLAISAAVVAIWLMSPLIFLIAFLVASGFHFSGDPIKGTSVLTRVAIGVGVITLPSIMHGAELQNLYSLLTNVSVAQTTVQISLPLAWLALVLGGLAIIVEMKNGRYATAVELVVIGLNATFAPPLLAFTVYFCLMHSARHILRTAELVEMPKRAFAIECVLPMVGVLVTGAIAWRFSGSLSLDAKAIQIVFVTLAALTAPHMFVVEPVRFGGWKDINGKTPGSAT